MPTAPLLRRLVRYRLLILGVLMAEIVVASLFERRGIDDWQFFDWGSRTLLGDHTAFIRPQYHVDTSRPGGLHLYGSYPFLQIGPPALLVARLASSRTGALLIVAVLGLVSLYAVDRAARLVRGPVPVGIMLGGGAMVVVAWAPLVRSAHLDDAMALTGLTLALWALAARRPLLMGLCLGLAAASKPWAVALVPLALALPTRRARAVLTAVGVVAACWLPFVLTDPATLQLGAQGRVLGPGTPLGLVPFDWLPPMQTVRLLQFAVGALLVAALAVRGRWEWAALAAFSWRLILEPNAFGYYSAAMVVSALVVDAVRGRRVPVVTIVVALVSIGVGSLSATSAAWGRLGLYVVVMVVASVVLLADAAAARPAQ